MVRISLNTIDKVKTFNKLATDIESDVFVKTGKYVVDGKSLMGLFSLNLSNTLEMEIVERVDGEEDKFINSLDGKGIILFNKMQEVL